MMLVLSRKLGEKICIDGEIEVEVLEIKGNRVRLGISAPNDRRIVRAERCLELYDASRSRPEEALALASY
jgi:carbon storage regulator